MEDNIEKVVKNGHSIADKIEKASDVSEIENLSKEIEEYCNFVCENFGTVSDFDGEKECDLTTFLYVALDWKKKSLYPENEGNVTVRQLAEEYMSQFIEELDSKTWVK